MWNLAVQSPSARLRPLAQYANHPYTDWSTIPLLDAVVTQDRTQSNRWSCSLTASTKVSVDFSDLHAYGTRLRLWVGLQLPRGPFWYVPAGRYYVRSALAKTTQVTISGSSYESEVQDTVFPSPRAVPDSIGLTYRQQLEVLVKEAVHDATFNWDRSLADLAGQPIPSASSTSDRWALVQGGSSQTGIASAMAAEIFCDAAGVFVIQPIPTLNDPAVWTIRTQQVQTLNDLQQSYDRSNVPNLVAVSGQPASGEATVGPVFAWDSDPNSLTYAGPDPVHHPELSGPYGVKTTSYSSPLLTDLGQCQSAAQTYVKQLTGAQKQLTLYWFNNPAVQAGDVVVVEVGPNMFETHLVDVLSYSCSQNLTTLTTRATRYGPWGVTV